MPDSELKSLRLFAPLQYRRMPLPLSGGFPFADHPAPETGDEDLALYDPDTVIRDDPAEGPRVVQALPPPEILAASSAADGETKTIAQSLELERGIYGFLQGRASNEGELRILLEGFARQVWWERFECQGPLMVRRIFEDGRWAVQVWRRSIER